MKNLLLILSLFLSISMSAQMEIDGEILYGNEWIDYSKTYVKITVNQDGIYRISKESLSAEGVPTDQISLKNLQLFHLGESIGFYVDQSEDFIEFYGKRNRIELDRFMYEDYSQILNPEYSVISDESAYFITWDNSINPLLFTESITDLSSNSLNPEEYYIHEELNVESEGHYKPTIDNEQVRYSNFVSSEGYGAGLLHNYSVDIPVYDFIENVEPTSLEVRFGANKVAHITQISINNEPVDTLYNFANDIEQHNYVVAPNEINENVSFRIKGLLSPDSDKSIVAYVKLTYPRAYEMIYDSVFTFSLSPSFSERYIEIGGYEGNETPIIYNITNNERIIPELTANNKIGFVVGSNSAQQNFMLVNPESGYLQPSSISNRVMEDYSDESNNYIIVTNSLLRNQGPIDQVQEYADYRSSDIGGNFNVVIVDANQLFDQFAYGVDRHSIAMRNFAFWTQETYANPEFMFIIGKGLEYVYNRTEAQMAENGIGLVPTWGNPGSDNVIVTSDDSTKPIYPVGRIAVETADEIQIYLDKIKAHDQNSLNPLTIEDRLWQKKVLHLSGGTTDIQENLFNNLAVMADTIENNMFGADVITFRKVSTDAISEATSDQIFEQINTGVSLLTFFGHASVGSFDFNLDNVERYENSGKYPLILSLGCYSGNIFTTNDESISEDFVKASNKGAIAFLAASGTAYIGVQNRFGKEFYSRLGGADYGKALGTVLNNVREDFKTFTNYDYVTFFQQLTFHGDPALRMPNFETPDFIPDATTIKTDPKFIDTYEESFEVCFDVANIGKALEDTFAIQVIHQNPQGENEFEVIDTFPTPSNRDNYCFTIPITSRSLVGRNKILVHVDNENMIVELPAPDAESNNYLRGNNNNEGFEFFILNNSAVPVFPREYSIVNTDEVKLIANTFNAFGEEQEFIIEIDTTKEFNSPILKSQTFEKIKSVLSWDLTEPLMEGVVYYWRVGSENRANEEVVWRESSFVYEPGERSGWNQSHYFQFIDNEFNNVEYDSLRQLKFVDNVKEIVMDNGPLVEFRINSSLWGKWRRNINSGVAVVFFDPVLGNSLRNYQGNPQYGSVNTNVPVGAYTHHFEFNANTLEERQNILNVLTDSIPDGYIVAVHFVEKDANFDYDLLAWDADTTAIGTSILKLLENEGALRLDELRENGSVPYIFAYKKGENKVLAEVVATEENEQITALFQIKTLWDKGDVTSKLIGPSTEWDEVVWEAGVEGNDTVKIDIIGVRMNGTEMTLIEDVEDNSIDLSTIDANEFPFIKLNYYSADPDLSVSQIEKFRVYYEGITDLAINPDDHFVYYKPEIEEGDILKVEVDITNVSDKDAPETTILYSIIDEENNKKDVVESIGAIAKGESKRAVFEYNTRGLKGTNTLQMLLNPNFNPMEQQYFNNLGLTEFGILPDNKNPLLNVTFDGVQIMDNDIVSAQPFIRIELDDSNPYLLLDDYDNFVLSLTDPTGEIRQISLDDPSINFIAATSDADNTAVVEYTPELADGEYSLAVQGKDVSGNLSGDLSYEINFRVFNAEMVSNVFNYPNPFSTSTQFIFTLTGNEEPGNVLIRIMTLSGKVVREITMAELGTLRVGLNRTEYKWDGTDEFGQKLGNGTYLYQVITKKMDGSNYEHFSDPTQNNTDYLFKEGFGKLVIMR